MANKYNENAQDDQMVSDLLRNAQLSSLQFEEPEITTFDMQSVFQDSSLTTRSLGKRVSKPKQEEEIIQTAPQSFFSSKTQNLKINSQESSQESSDSKLVLGTDSQPQPKTFAQLLHSSLYHDEKNQPEELDPSRSFFDGSKTTSTSAQELVQAAMAQQSTFVNQDQDVSPKESKIQKLFDDEDNEEAVYDPSASLVDDYHYDEYVDKKRF